MTAPKISTPRMPTLFVSHGGGPWPYIPEMRAVFKKTEEGFKALPRTLPSKPRAILVVSGHWEESEFTVSTAEKPPMVYDYYGFPAHTYQISYPAPGSPELAARVGELLSADGIVCRRDSERGFDHGTFVPVGLMYPDADIPVVSLSLKSNYDPADHLRLGHALAPLRDEGVLIIGSGLSYHNMRGFRSGTGGEVSEQFERWLTETVTEPQSTRRNERLVHWENAPAARPAHPQEDHLIPLMVVAGAAGDGAGEVALMDHAMGVLMASYRFNT